MQIIQWTGNALAALLKDVSVNHRGRHVAVSQQLLKLDGGMPIPRREPFPGLAGPIKSRLGNRLRERVPAVLFSKYLIESRRRMRETGGKRTSWAQNWNRATT